MRTIGAPLAQAELESTRQRGLVLVELRFDSGIQRLSNGRGNLTWNGAQWLGMGRLLRLDPIRESSAGEVTGGKITLAGGSPADISMALTENVQGREVVIYHAVLDDSHALLDVLTETFCRADRFRIVRRKTEAVLELTIESEMAMARRAKVRRWTHEDQRARYPADTGMRHLNRMKEFVLRFPTADAMRR